MSNLLRLIFITLSSLMGLCSLSLYGRNLSNLGFLLLLGSIGWLLASFIPKLIAENASLKNELQSKIEK